MAELFFDTKIEGEFFDELNIFLVDSQIYTIPVYFRVLKIGLNPIKNFLDFGLIIYGIESSVLNKIIVSNNSDEPIEIEDILIEFDSDVYPCFNLKLNRKL